MGLDLDAVRRAAPAWAATIVAVLDTPFPWQAQHTSSGVDDCDVTPWVLHPSFHGSLDWHSSCHMQWSAVRLLDLASHELDDDLAAALTARLDERLTVSNCAVEARYLREHPGYERPYGWAWALVLTAGARESTHPHAPAWAAALTPLAEAVEENLLAWLPKLAYPVRTGQHDNTAFGLLLARDALARLGRQGAVDAVDEHARRLYLADRDYPSHYEPSGNDFLSAALSEAELMSHVLPTEQFSEWIAAFLPRLAQPGDVLLEPTDVLDPADGKLVHLVGLELSRASSLAALMDEVVVDVESVTDVARAARIRSAIQRQIAAAEQAIVEGHFMATHWLVSFALRAHGMR